MSSSSEDESRPKRAATTRPKRKTTAAVEPCFSSDSDDSVLNAVTITRKKKPSKSKRSVDRILNSALTSCQKNVEEQRQLAIAKREGEDHVDVDVVEKAQTMMNEEAPSKKKKREENPDDDDSSFGDINMEGIDDAFDAKEHRQIKIEASETQQTDVFGTKHRTATLTSCGATPKSTFQALAALQHSVLDARPRGMSSALRKALTGHLENGTLHWFLTTCQLCKNKRFGKIPGVLLDWLVAVAVTSTPPLGKQRHLPSLVHGAFATLERVLKNPSLYLEDDCKFTLRDLSSQLEKWIAKASVTSDSNGDASGNDTKEESSSSTATKSRKRPPSDDLAPSRYLRLWELAFTQQRVHVDSDLRRQASSSIVRLLVLGLDEAFASCRTSTMNSTLSSLEIILKELLTLVARDCNIDEEEMDRWMDSLALEILQALSPGEFYSKYVSTESDDKETPMLAQVRSVRCIISAGCNRENVRAIRLGVKLSILVLQECLKVEKDNNDKTTIWESELSSLMGTWEVSSSHRDMIQSKALASAVLALTKLSRRSSSASGKAIYSIVELSHLCLQASTALFVWDDRTNRKLSAPVGAAYEQLEDICAQIAGQTHGSVLCDPHLLKANLYVSSMRQYPRLMKQQYQSGGSGDKLQVTLDGWFKPPTSES